MTGSTSYVDYSIYIRHNTMYMVYGFKENLIIADSGVLKPILVVQVYFKSFLSRFICMLFSTYTWALKISCNDPQKIYLPLSNRT